ncbi:MAG: TolC family protein, partial [Janthinobacterium lividum]
MIKARSELAHQQAIAKMERTRRFADVSVTLGARRSEELGRTQAIIGLSMPIPLFDTNQGLILEFMRRVEKSRDEVSQLQIRLENELV